MIDRKHLARPEHPVTSHQAAAEVVEDGTVGRMCEIARSLLRSHPGRTAAELEQLSGYGDGKVRKRLNDLRQEGHAKNGEPKRCSVTGKMAQTWYESTPAAPPKAQPFLFDISKDASRN
jgi:hypothetical protein